VPSWDVVNRRRWGPKPKLTDGPSRGARDVLLGLHSWVVRVRLSVEEPFPFSFPLPHRKRSLGAGGLEGEGGHHLSSIPYLVLRGNLQTLGMPLELDTGAGGGHCGLDAGYRTGHWRVPTLPLHSSHWVPTRGTGTVPPTKSRPLGAFLRCTLQLQPQLQLRCGACVRYVRCSYDGTSVCAVVVLPRYCSCSAAPLSHGCAGGEEKEEGRMTAKGEAVHFPTVLSFHYSSAQRPMRQWLSTVLGYGYGPSRCGW
jgi:hypothetical protein